MLCYAVWGSPSKQAARQEEVAPRTACSVKVDQTFLNITNIKPAAVFTYANYWRACAFVSALDSTYVHIHPFHLLWSGTHLHAANLKQEHDRRGSRWIRSDSAPETMAGKQALHKSLHSHLQLFARGKRILLIQRSRWRDTFCYFLFCALKLQNQSRPGKQNRFKGSTMKHQ